MASNTALRVTPVGLPDRTERADFSAVLARTIASVSNDPAQLRNIVYELARMMLQREALRGNPRMTVLETRRLMLALETAIERMETLSHEQDELQNRYRGQLSRRSHIELPAVADPRRALMPVHRATASPKRRQPAEPVSEVALPLPSRPAQRRSLTGLGQLLRAGFVIVIIAVSCTIVDITNRDFSQLNSNLLHFVTDMIDNDSALGSKVQSFIAGISSTERQGPPQLVKSVAAPQPAASQSQSTMPLPSTYGVYAVSNRALNELRPLPGRVPDQRVFMSSLIKTQSMTVLPNGRVVFIVYRRDVATSAPDRVQVRAIAKIAGATTFSKAGKASTTMVEDEWTIRSASFELRVAPVSENPEMLLVRPEDAEFDFPPGRYGLVLKGMAYDFTVAGPVTEPAQCLERVEAANGVFYSECKR
jgi:hypothetical protein